MLVKSNETVREDREHMRGGDGTVRLNAYLKGDALPQNCRLFSEIVLEPGCSIGNHPHEKECEIFYVLEGTASYHDNGTDVTAQAGDVVVCAAGQTHGVANRTGKPLRLLAVIVMQ